MRNLLVLPLIFFFGIQAQARLEFTIRNAHARVVTRALASCFITDRQFDRAAETTETAEFVRGEAQGNCQKTYSLEERQQIAQYVDAVTQMRNATLVLTENNLVVQEAKGGDLRLVVQGYALDARLKFNHEYFGLAQPEVELLTHEQKGPTPAAVEASRQRFWKKRELLKKADREDRTLACTVVLVVNKSAPNEKVTSSLEAHACQIE